MINVNFLNNSSSLYRYLTNKEDAEASMDF